jgi:hypothetical protein
MSDLQQEIERVRELVANAWSPAARAAAAVTRGAKKKIKPKAVGQWVVHPVSGKRGVVDHVYHDNVNEKGKLVQVDYGAKMGGNGTHKENHRESAIKHSKDQKSKWAQKSHE